MTGIIFRNCREDEEVLPDACFMKEVGLLHLSSIGSPSTNKRLLVASSYLIRVFIGLLGQVPNSVLGIDCFFLVSRSHASVREAVQKWVAAIEAGCRDWGLLERLLCCQPCLLWKP